MGSPAEPPADGEAKRRRIDADWEAMFESSSVSLPASAREPAASLGSEDDQQGGPRVAESSSADLPTATLEQDAVDPDERVSPQQSQARGEIATHSGSWAMATRDGSAGATSASASTASGRTIRDSEAEMAAIMGARRRLPESSDELPGLSAGSRAETSRPNESRTETLLPTEAPDELSRAPSPAEAPRAASNETTRDVARGSSSSETVASDGAAAEPAAGRPKTGPLARAPGSAARRMASVEPRRITARTAALDLGAKPRRPSLWWAVVAGIGIAAIAWIAGAPGRTNTPPAGRPSAAQSAEPGLPGSRGEPALAASKLPPPEDGGSGAPEVTIPPTSPKPEVSPTPVVDPTLTPTPVVDPTPTPARGVRTPPPGTPPDIAATFVRLPVSPADGPPVGGVGSSGIHIDRVEMGAGYDNKTGCTGVAKQFSLAANEEINVCVRVVHPREEEVMSIVWQKRDGSTARRGKIAVKPIHAYRTRAYLRLRAEYVGAWDVRIMSPDGVELVSHAFEITP